MTIRSKLFDGFGEIIKVVLFTRTQRLVVYELFRMQGPPCFFPKDLNVSKYVSPADRTAQNQLAN